MTKATPVLYQNLNDEAKREAQFQIRERNESFEAVVMAYFKKFYPESLKRQTLRGFYDHLDYMHSQEAKYNNYEFDSAGNII